jgi:hypothetical protein
MPDLDTTRDPLDDVLHLTSLAWLARERWATAQRLANACAPLPDLAEDVVPPTLGGEACASGRAGCRPRR